MLEWLKTILGDTYTEDIDKQVSAEIGKAFVARADFNAANEAKKTLEAQAKEHEKQLKDFQTLAGDNEELKTKLTQAQEANKTAKAEYETQLAKIKTESGVNEALASRKFVNDFTKDSLKAKIIEMVNLDENKGKSYADMLAALTHDEKGNELPNIFSVAQTQNPPPPVNGNPPAPSSLETTDMAAYKAAREKL